MPTVLFVCSANRFRSVIAEEQFRHLLVDRQTPGEWQVESAGTWAVPDLPPTSQALHFCRQKGWRVEKSRSREVSKTILENANLILTMTQGQIEALGIEFPQIKRKISLLSKACEDLIYDVSDPYEDPAMIWEEVGNEICSLVSNGFSRICRMSLRGKTNLEERQ